MVFLPFKTSSTETRSSSASSSPSFGLARPVTAMGGADGATALPWSGLADVCWTVLPCWLSEPRVVDSAVLAITDSVAEMLAADVVAPATFAAVSFIAVSSSESGISSTVLGSK